MEEMEDLKIIENDIVPVYETDKGEHVVYGSDLHKTLEAKTPYRIWSERRLEECDASEGLEFQAVQICTPGNPTPRKDHIILIDTAKEMAMLERNEKGKQVRKYFIEVEKRYKRTLTPAEMFLHNAQLMVEHERRLADIEARQVSAEAELKRISAKIETHPTGWYTIAGYASFLGINLDLRSAGELGRKAAKLSKAWGKKVLTTPDPRFGRVNVYCPEVLENVFEDA